MKVCRTAAELGDALRPFRNESKPIGFVPTMGALHEGHLSLVRAARAGCDVVVVSIFVNPLQFGPTEDLASYPRDEERDLVLARKEGVDVVFVPSAAEMYPHDTTTTIAVGRLGEVLEGAERLGHFEGVATVVAKLFNIVGPDIAYFGQKDAQQVAVVKRLIRDLSYGIELAVCPTVRDPNGLALSSRNVYLSSQEKARATALFRALREGADSLRTEGSDAARKRMWDVLVSEGLEPGYAEVVDPDTFGPPSPEGAALLVVAGRLGRTRLIDNLMVDARTKERDARTERTVSP